MLIVGHYAENIIEVTLFGYLLKDLVAIPWRTIVIELVNGKSTLLPTLNQVGKDDTIGPIDDDAFCIGSKLILLIASILRLYIFPPCIYVGRHNGITICCISQTICDIVLVFIDEIGDRCFCENFTNEPLLHFT